MSNIYEEKIFTPETWEAFVSKTCGPPSALWDEKVSSYVTTPLWKVTIPDETKTPIKLRLAIFRAGDSLSGYPVHCWVPHTICTGRSAGPKIWFECGYAFIDNSVEDSKLRELSVGSDHHGEQLCSAGSLMGHLAEQFLPGVSPESSDIVDCTECG